MGKVQALMGSQENFSNSFGTDIKYFLLRSFNFSFNVEELSITQKLGVISITPKGNKLRQYLKNWRPISLLNVSYKILSLSLANRLKNVLDKLIHENQKGFLHGQYIGENTRLLYDILNYTEQTNKTGILLLVDFEKAFDSVSWNFLGKVMNFFNFGPDFKKWVKLLLYDSKLCVIQNGIFSEFLLELEGDADREIQFPYIYFLLCVEILGILIRKKNKI